MCSCMSVPTGYGPDGTAADLISNAPVTKRDITFSVDFSADLGADNWFDQEEIVLAIREQFEQSGLFRRVHYVLPQNASATLRYTHRHAHGTWCTFRLYLVVPADVGEF